MVTTQKYGIYEAKENVENSLLVYFNVQPSLVAYVRFYVVGGRAVAVLCILIFLL